MPDNLNAFCVQGASFVECDVVLTKDCQLICRHEPDLVATTDAKTKFPELVRNYTIDSTLSGRVSVKSSHQEST